MEFRLLLSPDNDCASPGITPLALDVDVAILAGRDRRFSLSISDRRGRFGVNSSVNSNTGVDIVLGVEVEFDTGVSFRVSFSDDGVDVIGVNGAVYH